MQHPTVASSPRESSSGIGPSPLKAVLVGADFGKVTTSLAWGHLAADGALVVDGTSAVRHMGEPLEPFFSLYRDLGAERLAGIAATGAFGDRLTAPVLGGIPEEIALERAAELLVGVDGPLNIVRIGGSGYSVLTRDAAGRIEYETNERCSAGTGETVEGLCSRLGCTLDEAITLAAAADKGIAVTSRCAVFAKSELTHFANQGEDHGRLFLGLFESVARNVHALYDRAKVDGPVVLVGHGALIAPLADAFAAAAGQSGGARRSGEATFDGDTRVEVSPHAGVFEALGALRFAALRAARRSAEWPADPEALVVPRRGRIRALTPANAGPGSVVALDDTAVAGATGATTSDGLVLGLDLGSSGSKAVLCDPDSGAAVATVYRRTDGNPVEAAKRLIDELGLGNGDDVVGGGVAVTAVGITGSGRDAVATVMHAAYPELAGRIMVLNEIVAHAAAAVHFDPGGGRSLSIVEIGGQDAKFINVRDGRVLESDMNRVCSAGTGSFLEEQAQAHGLDDITLFGELAARSENPPDLGTTCTVFVADVAAEALADGFTRDDIFAGLQYSVIRNYIGRVMGDRRFLHRVFFQGKPATNPSLARTLAAVTGREVVVPPDPGAMGALGIAMLAAGAVAAAEGGPGAADDHAFDFSSFLSARVAERKTGRCGDKQCSNLCRLETAIIEVAGERRRVVSGGNCPKYDSVAAVGTKLPQDAPTPYREREELLAGLSADARGAAVRIRAAAGPGGAALGGLRIGLPYAHYLVDTLPFFETFFAHLGADVRVLRPTVETLTAGDRRCAAPGACAPVKIAHGLTGPSAADVRGSDAASGRRDAGPPLDVLFAPKFVNLPPDGASGTYTCPIAQGTPEMLDHALRAEGEGGPGGAGGSGAGGSSRQAGRLGGPAGRNGAAFVLRPVFLPLTGHSFASDEFTRELREAARSLGVAGEAGDAAFRAARDAALAAWERYRSGLLEIGARALAFARAERFPVVLVVGETHVVHDPVINSGIHDLIAANGAVALPLDCYPVDDTVPGLLCVHWAGAGQTLRAAVDAASTGDVFPLLLCAYGCGPNSFVEHLFDDLLADYPHTVLESDGHGGAAGYVTRVQAFLHAAQGYRDSRGNGHGSGSGSDSVSDGATPSPVDPERLTRCERPVMVSLRNNRQRTFLFGNIGGSGGRFAAATMRGAGIDARFVGATSPAALERGREGCSGKECLPYQLIWGTLAEYLAEYGTTLGPDGVVFVSIGRGFRACRPNLFPVAQQIQLERLGYKGTVEVGDFTLVFEDWSLTSSMWVGLAAADLLNMMRYYHYAAEPRRGAADALHAAYADRLEALLAAPRLSGKTKGFADARALLTGCEVLIGEAARDFAALEGAATGAGHAATPAATGVSPSELRRVYLCGDIYLRVDEWGNDDLQRKLADQGLRIVLEPYGEIFELLAERDARDYGLTSRQGAKRIATLKFMRYVVRRLLGVARAHEPWLEWADVADVWDASEPLLDGYPFGESIPTIGGALHAWATQPVDGVVVVSPRGCGPALVSEAQLRRGADFPLLFVYNDGDPIDEARLAGFAWRLREREPRTVVAADPAAGFGRSGRLRR